MGERNRGSARELGRRQVSMGREREHQEFSSKKGTGPV